MAAALWEEQLDDQLKSTINFTIITTEADESISWIHERMPLVLDKSEINEWLNLDNRQSDVISLLNHRADGFQYREVSPYVNSVKNNSIKCLNPPEPPLQLELF